MKRGFTIIELIVAMSLVILLVAIGLPRYNDLSRKTEFGDGSQKLVGCLQQAQQASASPRSDTSPVGYSIAGIIDTGDGKVGCSVDIYGPNTTFDSYGAPTSIASRISSQVVATVDGMTICSLDASLFSATVTGPSFVLVLFGALEGGAPRDLHEIGGSSPGTISPVPFRSGIQAQVMLAPYSVSHAASCAIPAGKTALPLSSTISMARLGVPIQLK